MEAFYVTIIFLGVVLVAVSLFLIIMDRVNGKDFFKEFDRKKDEMFNLIQDSEEMVHELNRMSDYVVTVIEEKNQEFFNKMKSKEKRESILDKKAETLSENDTPESVKETKSSKKSEVHEDLAPIPVPSQVPEAQKVLQKEKETVTPIETIVPNVQKSINIQSYKNFTQDKVKGNTVNYKNENIKPDIESIEDIDTEPYAEPDKDHDLESVSSRNTTKLVLNNRRKEVLQLIEQGLSNDEIAEKLKIGKGEIGLIRGLSNSK